MAVLDSSINTSGRKVQVKEVPLKYVNLTWPYVQKFLEKSVPHAHGEFTIEEVKVYVVQGLWSLYVIVDENEEIHGAITVQFLNRTDNRVAFITNISGKLLTDKNLFSQLSDILRSNGATCIEGSVRDSLVRLWSRIGACKKYNTIQFQL